jgi:hypothetical protein
MHRSILIRAGSVSAQVVEKWHHSTGVGVFKFAL